MNRLVIIILIALSVRLIAWGTLGTNTNFRETDNMEYYHTSINLEPSLHYQVQYGGFEWWEHSPLYVLFLHVTQRQLAAQVLLSVVGVVLLYKINPIAGWIWCLYPQDIIYSFQYGKECLLIFLIITAVYLFMIGFSSIGGVVEYNRTLSQGFMDNVWEMWKPSFGVSDAYLYHSLTYLQAVPYLVLGWLFIRKAQIGVSVFLIAGFTIVYSSVFAQPRYRDPLIPLILLDVLRGDNC